jgi:hypothetical protein
MAFGSRNPVQIEEPLIQSLLGSSQPAIRYKTLVNVQGYERDAPGVLEAQSAIPGSILVRTLLAERDGQGQIPLQPYAKWRGAHWVLACLADLGYPPGDTSLQPLLEQVYAWLLGKQHTQSIKTIAGLVRRCASMEGNALYASLCLGLADERSDELAARLMRWQWPDGGWNCDKRRAAYNSSYHETLIPMRALIHYARVSGDRRAYSVAEQAAEIFLKRSLFKRQRDGQPISEDFMKLHYPCYWHYDFLFGLKVLAEAGWIDDPRCSQALELLESKRLEDGGFPAEVKYYRLAPSAKTGRSLVSWGPTGNKGMNEYVTVDALFVLKSARRCHCSGKMTP